LTHTYLANIGGFVIRSKGEQPFQSSSAGLTRKLEDQFDVPLRNLEPGIPASLLHRDTQYVSIIATAFGWNKTLNEFPRSTVGRKRPQGYTLSRLGAQNILDLREAGLLARLPDITLEEIDDKSKGDAFVAKLAFLQGMWLVLQVILRLQRTMTVSQLTNWATAYIGCAILTYSLKLSKPRGINVPFIVASYENGIPPKVLASIGPLNSTTPHDSSFGFDQLAQLDFSQLRPKPFRTTGEATTRGSEPYRLFLNLNLSLLFFVGVRILGFLFVTPKVTGNTARDTFWVIFGFFSIVTTITTAIACQKLISRGYLQQGVWNWLLRIDLGLHTIMRLFILFEAFHALLYLPADTNTPTLIDYIPIP
jgi:hypothetical protein